MQHLFDKYVRMMDWDVPENDEANARRLIIQAMKQALGDVESQV